MLRRKKAPEPPAPPCGHPGQWVPEAIIGAGTKHARAVVVCFECGWQGRVPLSAVQKEKAGG